MKLGLRHFAAAGLLICPLMAGAQELPSAPSAVAAQQEFQKAETQITFTKSPGMAALPTDQRRLSSDEKFNSFVAQSTSGYATFSSAIAASFRPSWNESQYTENYASRFGHAISDQTEQGFFTKFLLPSVFHQDPRYHLSTDTGTGDRAAYALSRVLITRNDNGRPTLNTSELLGAVLAASITTAYHPYRHYTPGQTADRAAGSIGADAGINMLREFWPDIRERLIDHGPKVMQSLVTHFGPRVISGTAPSIAPAN
jgi:hypothetical protein